MLFQRNFEDESQPLAVPHNEGELRCNTQPKRIVRSSVTGMDMQRRSEIVRSLCKEPSSHSIRKELIIVPPEKNDYVAYEFVDYGNDLTTGNKTLPKWNWGIGRVTAKISQCDELDSELVEIIPLVRSGGRIIPLNLRDLNEDNGQMDSASFDSSSSVTSILSMSADAIEMARRREVLTEELKHHQDALQKLMNDKITTMKEIEVESNGNRAPTDSVRNGVAAKLKDITASILAKKAHVRELLDQLNELLSSTGDSSKKTSICGSENANISNIKNTSMNADKLNKKKEDRDGVSLAHAVDCVHFSLSTSSRPQLILTSAIFITFDRDALQGVGLLDVQTGPTISTQMGFDSVYIPKILIKDILANTWLEGTDKNERDCNSSPEFIPVESSSGQYIFNSNNSKSITLATGFRSDSLDSIVQKVLETPLPPAAYKTTKQMDLAKSIATNPLLVNGLTMAYHEAQDALAIAEFQCSILKEEVKRQHAAGFALRCEAEHLDKMLEEYKEEITLLRENETKLVDAVFVGYCGSTKTNDITHKSSISGPFGLSLQDDSSRNGCGDFLKNGNLPNRDKKMRRFLKNKKYQCYTSSMASTKEDMLLKEDKEIAEAVFLATSTAGNRRADLSMDAQQLSQHQAAIQRMKDIIDRLRLERGTIWADFESYCADAERELDQIYDAHESLQQRFVETQKKHLHVEALQRRTQEKADASAMRVTDIVSKLKLMMARTHALEGCINDICGMTNMAALVESDYLTHVQLQEDEDNVDHVGNDSVESKPSGTKDISRADMELLRLAVTKRIEEAGISVRPQVDIESKTAASDSYAFINQVSIPIKKSTYVQATQGSYRKILAIINKQSEEEHTSLCNINVLETSTADNAPHIDAKKDNTVEVNDKGLPLERDSLLFNQSALLVISEYISALEKRTLKERKRADAVSEKAHELGLELWDATNSTNDEYLCSSGTYTETDKSLDNTTSAVKKRFGRGPKKNYQYKSCAASVGSNSFFELPKDIWRNRSEEPDNNSLDITCTPFGSPRQINADVDQHVEEKKRADQAELLQVAKEKSRTDACRKALHMLSMALADTAMGIEQGSLIDELAAESDGRKQLCVSLGGQGVSCGEENDEDKTPDIADFESAAASLVTIREKIAYADQQLKDTIAQRDVEKQRVEQMIASRDDLLRLIDELREVQMQVKRVEQTLFEDIVVARDIFHFPQLEAEGNGYYITDIRKDINLAEEPCVASLLESTRTSASHASWCDSRIPTSLCFPPANSDGCSLVEQISDTEMKQQIKYLKKRRRRNSKPTRARYAEENFDASQLQDSCELLLQESEQLLCGINHANKRSECNNLVESSTSEEN